jgi:hypothetical protein
MSADAAPLAVIQVGFKIPFLIRLDAPLRAEKLADAALDASGEFIGRPL